MDKDTDNVCNRNPIWDPNYMLCMKSILPETKSVTYERKSRCCGNFGKKPIDWKDPFFFQEDNSNGPKGYRVPCRGDSGSGQVVSISIDPKLPKSFKYVLASIYTGTMQDNANVNGINMDMPCGALALIYDFNSNRVDTLESQALAQSTSWPKILDWIKNKAKIK